jgi:hypothetical protein
LTRREEADIAARFGQAIKAVADQKSEVVTPQDFIDNFLKLDIKASTKPDQAPAPVVQPEPVEGEEGEEGE